MLGTFRNWVEIVRRTLDAEGVDLENELAARGVSIGEAEPDAGRLPAAVTRLIWDVVDERSSGRVFGLTMLRHVDWIDFEELGIKLVASGGRRS